MITTLKITQSDLNHSTIKLSPEAQRAAIEAWDDYSEFHPVKLNTENIAAEFVKESIINRLVSSAKDNIKFMCDLYADFDLNEEDDYSSLVNGIRRQLNF